MTDSQQDWKTLKNPTIYYHTATTVPGKTPVESVSEAKIMWDWLHMARPGSCDYFRERSRICSPDQVSYVQIDSQEPVGTGKLFLCDSIYWIVPHGFILNNPFDLRSQCSHITFLKVKSISLVKKKNCQLTRTSSATLRNDWFSDLLKEISNAYLKSTTLLGTQREVILVYRFQKIELTSWKRPIDIGIYG